MQLNSTKYACRFELIISVIGTIALYSQHSVFVEVRRSLPCTMTSCSNFDLCSESVCSVSRECWWTAVGRLNCACIDETQCRVWSHSALYSYNTCDRNNIHCNSYYSVLACSCSINEYITVEISSKCYQCYIVYSLYSESVIITYVQLLHQSASICILLGDGDNFMLLK